jgi:hypothetical protein
VSAYRGGTASVYRGGTALLESVEEVLEPKRSPALCIGLVRVQHQTPDLLGGDSARILGDNAATRSSAPST